MSTATLPEPKTSEQATRTFKGRHHQQLLDLRDAARHRRIGAGFVAVLVLLIAGVALIAALDFFLVLSTSARLASLVTVVGGVTLLVGKFRGRLSFEADDAASTAEEAWPELGQRVRTSHDYAVLPDVAPADSKLIAALEHDTDEKTVGREFEPLAPAWPVWTAVGISTLR